MEDDDLMPTAKMPRIGKLPEKAPPKSLPPTPKEPPAPKPEAVAPVPPPPSHGMATPMPIIPDLPPVPAPGEEAPGQPEAAAIAEEHPAPDHPRVEMPWFLQSAPAEAEEAPWAPSSWRPPSSQAPAHPPAPPAPPAMPWSAPQPAPPASLPAVVASSPSEPAPSPTSEAPPAWIQSIQAAPSAPTEIATEEEEPMATQWEYCRVQLDSGSYSQKQTVGRYPYFVRVSIDYYGAEVPPTANFGEDTDQMDRPNKVWGKIVGLLGLANWEMVNVYLGTAKDLSLVNVMAYFKRPVQPGRAVDEPKIKL